MLHTEKIASKLEQLSIKFDMEGEDNEESFFFAIEGVHFQVYFADGSYVFEASIKVEEFGFMELKEIATRDMKTLRSLEKFINENVVNGMEKLAELNKDEEDTTEETETTVSNNETSAIENFKTQVTANNETIKTMGTNEMMQHIEESIKKMNMVKWAYKEYVGRDLFDDFSKSNNSFVDYQETIFIMIQNGDTEGMKHFIASESHLSTEYRYMIIEHLHNAIARFNASKLVSMCVSAGEMQDEYEKFKQQTITNEHGVTITKEELEYIKQDVEQANNLYKTIKNKEELKDKAVEYVAKELKGTIACYGIEWVLKSQTIESMAKYYDFNLADFVYQIVLAYNEISEIVTPVASKVNVTEEIETTPFINHLFNTMDEYFDEMEVKGNTFIGMHGTKTITIVDTMPIMCYMDDEWTNERAEFEAFEEWEVTDFIDNKLS